MEHELTSLVADGDNAAGVVASRLQDVEPIDADLACFRVIAYVSHDTTSFGFLLPEALVEEVSSEAKRAEQGFSFQSLTRIKSPGKEIRSEQAREHI